MPKHLTFQDLLKFFLPPRGFVMIGAINPNRHSVKPVGIDPNRLSVPTGLSYFRVAGSYTTLFNDDDSSGNDVARSDPEKG